MIDGVWYETTESRSVPAQLILAPGNTLRVRTSANERQILADASHTGVEVSTRVGSIPRTFTFPNGKGLFETYDNDAVDTLLRQARGKSQGNWVHSLEQFRLHLIAVVAAILISVFAIYRYGLPVMVEVAVMVTPPIVPELMGSGTMRSLDATIFGETELSDERLAPIRQGFDRLTAVSDLPADSFTLNFRASPRVGPNAFALPDGTIIVTDELIRLVGRDETVIGILGHEIGHVERQHSLRQFYRTAGVAALILLISGDVGAVTEDVLVQGTLLLQMSYSREAELEADRRSVELMYEAGMDPAAAAPFFALLERRFGDTRPTDSYLSTHPASPRRRQLIEDYANEISGP
ncbi:MAG: M48 family metallopeptidase [Pseudomonadota bacterium]